MGRGRRGPALPSPPSYMWFFWAFLVFVRPLGGPPLGPPSCPWEPFEVLIAIMEALGNRNEGTLYTPDSLSVCPMETLHCFGVELSVIGYEEGPAVVRAVIRLQRSLTALGSHLWGARWGAASGLCPRCEEYPERPVLQFLTKLLEILHLACAGASTAGLEAFRGLDFWGPLLPHLHLECQQVLGWVGMREDPEKKEEADMASE